jgi:DNA ligase 1
VARDGITVYVRPELVVEVAFNEVQASTQYPGGVALRFARIKRYRTDKSPVETDTIGTVQEIYRRLTGGPAAPTER